jgi:hypothetical protein
MDLTLRLKNLMGYDDIDSAHRAAAALVDLYSGAGARRIIQQCYDYPNGIPAAQYAIGKALQQAELHFGKGWDVAVIEREPRPCMRFRGSVAYGDAPVREAQSYIIRQYPRVTPMRALDDQFFYLIVPRGAARAVKAELRRHISVSIGALD